MAIMIWLTHPPPVATCGSSNAPGPPIPTNICGSTNGEITCVTVDLVGTVVIGTVVVGTAGVMANVGTEGVTAKVLAVGAVTVGVGKIVGGVGMPLKVGVAGNENVGTVGNVVVGNVVVGNVVVVNVDVDAVDVVAVAAVVAVNCAATGNDVKLGPLNARATAPIGRSELMNISPVKG